MKLSEALRYVYPPSGLMRFINVIGISATKELFYTGLLCDAARARDMRLVDHVVPAQQLTSFTYDIARQIAQNAPLSIRGTKATISRLLAYQNLSPQAKDELLTLAKQAADSEDLREGQRAFAEKRRAVFKGK